MINEEESSEDVEEDIDPENYKGIFYNVDQENKYQDTTTGAHFRFKDMCNILQEIKRKRDREEERNITKSDHNNIAIKGYYHHQQIPTHRQK